MSRMKETAPPDFKQRKAILTIDLDTISHCGQCQNHTIISDPDPNDFMGSCNTAVTCFASDNPTRDMRSPRVSSRSQHRVIASGMEANDNIADYNIPKWCPLRKQPEVPVAVKPVKTVAKHHIENIRTMLEKQNASFST